MRFTVLAVVVALIPLGAMLTWVIGQGGSSLDLNFFTQVPRAEGEVGGGMINAILGTMELVAFASLIGLPIGIMTGIYLARAGSEPFAQVVRFVSDVIAGTPSIVAGMVGIRSDRAAVPPLLGIFGERRPRVAHVSDRGPSD